MASAYSSRLRLELMGSGDQTGTWGTTTNTNLGTLLEEAISGYSTVAMSDANTTLTANNGSTDQARQMMLKFTGTLTASRNIVVPTSSKLYFVENATTGGFSLVVKTTAGSGITVPAGMKTVLYCDGTNVVDAVSWLSALTVSGAASVGGAATITGTLSPLGLIDASGASAGQIKFPAAQNPSADVNTLDDYEEGTWTPTITAATVGNLSVAYTNQIGQYTKIGRLVTATFRVDTSSFTYTTASGVMSVAGLPFTSKTLAGVTYCGGAGGSGYTKAGYTLTCSQVLSNATLVGFVFSGSSVTFASATITDFPTAGTVGLRSTVSYEV